MNNAEIVHHQGKDVLILNIANVPPVEVLKRIKAVEEKIVEFSQGSVYLLVMTANLAYNSITSSNLNEFATVYGKYLKASVVVDETFDPGTAPAAKEDGPKIFADATEALDWVTAQ